jgi:hypothetical protein
MLSKKGFFYQQAFAISIHYVIGKVGMINHLTFASMLEFSTKAIMNN